jgi:hypothetical protein
MSRLHTRVLSSGTITINYQDGVTSITLQANASSSCTITGNLPFQGVNSSQIVLENGESYTQQTPTNTPLDGITIAWVSGTIDVTIVQ